MEITFSTGMLLILKNLSRRLVLLLFMGKIFKKFYVSFTAYKSRITGMIPINTGRPNAISPRASRMLRSKFESGELINCTDGIKYLSSAAMGKVGGETIRRTLLKSGLKCYTKPLKPRLLPHHRAARLKFARDTQKAPESFWNHVVFTDESKFNLYAPDGNHTVWRRPGLPTKNHHFHHTVKFGGGR